MPPSSPPSWISRFFGEDQASGSPPTPRTEDAEVRRTICTFCSCGCGMEAEVRNGRLLYLEGDAANPINEGTLCSKGAASAGLFDHPDRIRAPRVREPGAADFQDLDWDQALDRIADKLFEIRDQTWDSARQRCEGLAFFGGAIQTNEEAYAFKKLGTALGLLGVEHQARI